MENRQRYDRPRSPSPGQYFKIQICNLPAGVEREQLRKAFETFGKVVFTEKKDTTAVIGFASKESAEKAAYQYDRAQFNG